MNVLYILKGNSRGVEFMSSMITIISFMISLFSLILGIILKCLVKDSDETIQHLAARIK
jgi:hypothetical protein